MCGFEAFGEARSTSDQSFSLVALLFLLFFASYRCRLPCGRWRWSVAAIMEHLLRQHSTSCGSRLSVLWCSGALLFFSGCGHGRVDERPACAHLWVYAILRSIPSKPLGVVAVAAAMGLLIALPFLVLFFICVYVPCGRCRRLRDCHREA